MQRFGVKSAPRPSGGSPILEAAERQGVQVLPADVGGSTIGKLTSGMAQTPLGAGPIVDAALAATKQGAEAAKRVAGGLTPDGYQVGKAGQRGMDKWAKATETRGGKFYNEIPIDDATDSVLTNTRDALATVNGRFSSNSELAGIMSDSRLKGIESAIVGRSENVPTGLLDSAGNMITRTIEKGGKLSWQDLKGFRSLIGERLDGMILQQDTAQSDLRALYKSLSADMEATARAQGPDALARFQRANRYWRARQDRLERVGAAIMGPDKGKGAQDAFNQINNWARTKGESAHIAQMMRSLPAEEAEIVSAGVINNIGRATSGKQDAAGDVFSFGTFLTNWTNIDNRAKAALFTPAQRSALNDLALISEGTKAGQSFANSSNTGGVSSLIATTTAATGAVSALATAHPFLAALAAAPVAIQRPLGHLLASPKFARWIVNAPERRSQQIAHIGKLGKIAGSNPALAQDAAAVERYILSAINDNIPVRAAASDAKDNQRDK
jgi:hypothetical protein